MKQVRKFNTDPEYMEYVHFFKTSKMYGLDKKAKAVLIINKNTKLEKPQQKQIQCLEKNGLTRWEDNYFKIVDLNEFKGC